MADNANPIFYVTMQKRLSCLPAKDDKPLRLLLGSQSRPVVPGYVPLMMATSTTPFTERGSVFDTDNIYKHVVRIYSKEANANGQVNEDTVTMSQSWGTLWRYELSYENLPGWPDTSGMSWEDSKKVDIAQALQLDAEGRAWLQGAFGAAPVASPARLVTRNAVFASLNLASLSDPDGERTLRLDPTSVEVGVSAGPGSVRVNAFVQPSAYSQRLLIFPGVATGAKVRARVNQRDDASLVRVVGGEWLASDVTFHPVLEIWTLPGEFDNNWHSGVAPILHQSVQLPPLTYSGEEEGASITYARAELYKDVLAEFTMPASRVVIPLLKVLTGSPMDFFNEHCPMIPDEEGYPNTASFDLNFEAELVFRESEIGGN